MDEKDENKLNEEIDEPVEELDENTESESNLDDEDEFEYDEDGNIIIPDISEDEEVDNEPVEDDAEKQDSEESSDSEEPPAEAPAEETHNEKDDRIAKLEKELSLLRTQGKETLSKLGVETDDILGGLEKLAAEADDIPVEEYRKNKAVAERDNEARKLLQKVEFEKKMKADLLEVQAAYPETKNLTSIEQIENFSKFGMLRDKGLSPKEAYAAANADSIRKSVASAVKQQSLNETKNHLKSSVPKGSKDNSITMPKSALKEWKDLFPHLSDKEIVALYKKTI